MHTSVADTERRGGGGGGGGGGAGVGGRDHIHYQLGHMYRHVLT